MTAFNKRRVIMIFGRALFVLALTACVRHAEGAATGNDPSVGYVYPAGGRQGAVIEVAVGGHNLRNVTSAYISGEGVRASVLQYLRPLSNEQRQELQRRLYALLQQRRAVLPGAARQGAPPVKRFARAAKKPDAAQTQPAKTEPVALPDYPLLRNLEQKSLGELREVARRFLMLRSIQPTPAAIAETVVLEITIAADAPPGERELRLQTPGGLTNPMRFEVGLLPEVCEHEPNGPSPVPRMPQMVEAGAPAAETVELPIVLNGQIMPGDADWFRFRARRGQNLVVTAQAQQLMPYLADAVPGWFQAMLTLYDAKGRELACADHYRFHPDPVLFYKVAQEGEYTLEIRDSIYRGREDFVYRVAVGEQPFITWMFPLGGHAGVAARASVAGWNLPWKQVSLDTKPGADHIRQAAWRRDEWLSNHVAYAVDALPECDESEPNDTVATAQQITLPRIVNGRTSRPSDTDVFRFKGRAGEQVVAEVYARRLDSPLDSLLRLTDASGRVIAANDDYPDKEMGLITHQADSYLLARLPRDGVYYVRLSDAEGHGGGEYAYRLRIGPPRPDFSLCVTPSGINITPTGIAVLRVCAFRKDGFDGDIEVALKDAPAGFALSGARIPRGRDAVYMTLAAPRGQPGRRAAARRFALRLEGRARIGGAMVSRPVLPADDMMQAFAYLHLVPAQQLVVGMGRSGGGAGAVTVELPGAGPLRIPAGGAVQVQVKAPPSPLLGAVQLELSDPPKGVTLGPVSPAPDGLAFTVQAERQAAQVGYADNLIVTAFAEMEGGPAGSKAAAQKRRVALGALPAIPFEIVR